jgi:hypothetical protein
MVAYTMVPSEGKLTAVEAEPYFRGQLIIAEDVRRHFLLIGTSMAAIQAGIEEACRQSVSYTCLYECARREKRKGVTGGAWSLVRLERDAAIKYWNLVKGKYAKPLIVSRRSSAWQLE